MYGKIFESMYDGTLSADWKAMVVFQQFIVLADSEGVVDYTPPALSRRTGIPLDIIEHGIEKLEQPDKYSRSADCDGRRIVLVDEHRPWGWLIVNYEHYRDIAKQSDKREKTKERVRKFREKQSQDTDSKGMKRSVTPCNADVTPLSVYVSLSKSVLDKLKKEYPKRAGSQPWARAEKAITARLKEDHKPDDILSGVERYAAFVKATGKDGTEFVMQAATFCGPEKHFLEPWSIPKTKSERRQDRNVDAAMEFLNED